MSTYNIIKIIVGLIVLFIIGMYVGGLVYQATGCCDCNCECEEINVYDKDFGCWVQIDFPCSKDTRVLSPNETEEYNVECDKNNKTWVKFPNHSVSRSFIIYFSKKSGLHRWDILSYDDFEGCKHAGWWQG